MLSLLPDTQAIIFDMDGVLFLSSTCHEQAFIQTLSEIGINELSYHSIAGMRTDEAFRKIFSELSRPLEDGELERLVKTKRERALAFLATGGEIAPGSSELIETIREYYKIALASSASPQTVSLFMNRSGYADAFTVVLDGSSVKNAKPAPDIYLLAAHKLGIEPKHCLVVEDAISGVQAALAAGMKVIALAEKGKEKQFLDAGATRVVSSLTELVE